MHGLSAHVTRFLRAQASSSTVLISAIVLALLWGGVDYHGYTRLWETPIQLRVGSWSLEAGIREWVSSGLMALFFAVVGSEARRELDLGSLRQRRQFALPVLAGVLGMLVPVGVFLLLNRDPETQHGWAVAMSTDTALALGLLTVASNTVPDRVKGFLLTLFIVDDLGSLVVIAAAYSRHVQVLPVVVSVLLFAAGLAIRRIPRIAVLSPGLAAGSWVAMFISGVDPLVVGLAAGLSAQASVPGRGRLERATEAFRRFREQPTPGFARRARVKLHSALSRNEQLQSALAPWTGYVIVPLFALSNAGLPVSIGFLRAGLTAPLTLAIVAAYVIGKPLAVIGVTWLASAVSRGRLAPPVGWASVAGTGTIAGVGFTISLLVAARAFHGAALQQATLGVLAAIVISSALTAAVFRIADLLPAQRRARALLGRGEQLLDLKVPVDPARDHIRGVDDAAITVVEYGDFQCPYCGRAEPAIRELLGEEPVRFVWRHLPIREVHPDAQLAAEAAEAASEQGAFWEMHDLLLLHQDALQIDDLTSYAVRLHLDVDRFSRDVAARRHASRIDEDGAGADESGVSGTPTFFINGRRHYGAYDADSLRKAVLVARSAALVGLRGGSASL
jgi:Na+/H+ antiporter NhaA